ncbi:MAG: bacteriohemerythrin [Thermodesulfobacteriota bacterium]
MTTEERRRYPRQETDIAVTAYKGDERVVATLIDISKSGFALLSEKGVSPGARLDIMIDNLDDYAVRGTVRWVYQVQHAGKMYHRIGIEAERILNTDDIMKAALPVRSGRIKGLKEIVWNQDFNVGIQQIDEQHKVFIEKINLLISSPQAATESGLLIQMTQYVREHFALEEELMAQYDYPDREAHIKSHQDFRNKTVEFCLAVMDKEEGVSETTLKYLRDWVENHILKVDMAFSAFFQKHGAGKND